MKTNLPACLCFLAALASAHAQITLTFNGTANSSAAGFNPGDHVTFSFTINSNYAGSAADDYTQNVWEEDDSAATALFTSFTGTGVTGTLMPPAPGDYNYIYITPGNGFMEVYLLSQPQLSVNGTTISDMDFQLNGSDANFVALEGPTDPTAYFSGFVGDHGFGPGGYGIAYLAGTNFDLTGFSITSGSAIPEPSTYAAIAGLGALGLTMLRRRRTV